MVLLVALLAAGARPSRSLQAGRTPPAPLLEHPGDQLDIGQDIPLLEADLSTRISLLIGVVSAAPAVTVVGTAWDPLRLFGRMDGPDHRTGISSSLALALSI